MQVPKSKSRDMEPTESVTGIESTIDTLSQIQSQQIIAIGLLEKLTKNLLASHPELAAQLRDLTKAQKRTNEKLNMLIDSVYRARRKEL
jgi:hypothetical protein